VGVEKVPQQDPFFICEYAVAGFLVSVRLSGSR
jgi:hypothetical protein